MCIHIKRILSLGLILFGNLLLIINTSLAQVSDWADNYPVLKKITNGTSFSLKLTRPGTIHYVVYSSPNNGVKGKLTSAQIISEAQSSDFKGLEKGVLEIADATASYELSLSAKTTSTYYIYLTASDGSGNTNDLNAKRFTKRQEWQTAPFSYNDSKGKQYKENVNYFIRYPEDFNSGSKSYPLLFFFPGKGEQASEGFVSNLLNAPDMIPYIIERDKIDLNSFIIVSPQTNYWWRPSHVNSLLGMVLNRLENRINASQIYLTGISAGGILTWGFPVSFPGIVAAVVPVSCTLQESEKRNACNMSDVSVWAIHNLNDQVVESTNSSVMVNALNNCPERQEEATLTTPINNSDSHNAWSYAYSAAPKPPFEMNIYSWLLTKSSDFNNIKITSPFNNQSFISGTNIPVIAKIEESILDGIEKVEFYSGSTLVGESLTDPYQDILTLTCPGAYTLIAKAFDNTGKICTSAGINIFIKKNQRPVVNLGPDKELKVLALSNITLTGTIYDEDGSIISYKWEEINGSSLFLENTDAAKVILKEIIPGSYTLKLTVADNNGSFSSDEITLTISTVSGVPPSQTTNLALGKNAFVDGTVPFCCYAASNAVDGDENTRWNSANITGNHWINVDLGNIYAVNQIVIKHAQAGGLVSGFNTTDFTLQYKVFSSTEWSTLEQITGNVAGVTSHNFDLQNMRYVQVYITKPNLWNPAAIIYELEVYGISAGRLKSSETENNFITAIYPIPATKNYVNLDFNETDLEILIELYDVVGTKLYTAPSFIRNYKTEIDLKNFSNGYYFLKVIKASNETHFVKLLKE